MAKKQKPAEGESRPTAVIRVDADLADSLNLLAQWRKKDVAEIASPIIRARISAMLAEMHRELGNRLKGGEANA